MILNSGSGRKYFDAMLIVTIDSGSTVTATLDDIVLTGTSDGTVKFDILKPGVWIIKAEKDGQVSTDTLNITEEKEYKIELYYAVKILNDNSWKAIHQIALKDQGENLWNVGDTKKITINGQVGNTKFNNLEVDAFIIGFNHNSSKEGNHKIHFQIGKINSKPIALCDSQYDRDTQDLTGWFHYNSSLLVGNKGGWARCDKRNTLYGNAKQPSTPLKNSLIAALPEELRMIMQSVIKYSDNFGGGVTGSDEYKNITPTTDWLFDLSEVELRNKIDWGNQYEKDFQEQYKYYKSGNTATAYNHNNVNTDVTWGLRSIRPSRSTYVCVESPLGSGYYYTSTAKSIGIRPAFCV